MPNTFKILIDERNANQSSFIEHLPMGAKDGLRRRSSPSIFGDQRVTHWPPWTRFLNNRLCFKAARWSAIFLNTAMVQPPARRCCTTAHGCLKIMMFYGSGTHFPFWTAASLTALEPSMPFRKKWPIYYLQGLGIGCQFIRIMLQDPTCARKWQATLAWTHFWSTVMHIQQNTVKSRVLSHVYN